MRNEQAVSRTTLGCARLRVGHPPGVRLESDRAEIRAAALAAVLPGVAALLACTHVSVGSSRDDAADFDRYRTFAVAAAPARVESHPEYDPRVGEVIRSELDRGLRARGLRPGAADRVDLAVSFQLSGRAGFSLTGQSFGENLHVAPYIDGHLSVAIFERRSERMVWHGWAALKEYRAGQGTERAREVTRRVIERFPRGGDG